MEQFIEKRYFHAVGSLKVHKSLFFMENEQQLETGILKIEGAISGSGFRKLSELF